MMNNNAYRIDERTKTELYGQIAELASSYTPEWIFDPANPDIGSVLAMLFADQLNGSIDRFNHVIDKYRVELVNLLGVGLMPAHPADGVCVLSTIQGATPGVDVPSGTKLLGTGEADADGIVFETSAPLHVTSAQIEGIMQVSGHFGKIISLRGDTGGVYPSGISALNEAPTGTESGGEEIKLFDFSGPGIEQNSIILYHENVFDVPEDTDVIIEITAPGGTPLAELLTDEENYRFRYYDGRGFCDYSSVRADGNRIMLRRDTPMQKVELDGGILADMIRIDALMPVTSELKIGNIIIHSMAEPTRPDFASNNENDLTVEAFMPFGETASLFDDCYIGSDSIFSKSGAEATISFKLDYREKLVTFTAEQMEESLKVVKRKPKRILYTTAHTKVERIAVEYFNGTGWRRLLDDEHWITIFDGDSAGNIELKFICPESWEPVTMGAHSGRCLRLRIESADNCYLQPCIHLMPYIEDLQISYRYTGEKKKPSHIECIRGTEKVDLTAEAVQGEAITAFTSLNSSFNSLYIGFDRKIEGRPISIYFGLKEKIRGYGVPLGFEYSTNRGFKPMRVTDETEGLSKNGVITMLPKEDIARMSVYGQNLFWIRIKDEKSIFNDPERIHPVITEVLPNAVKIKNERTLDEDSYYIDEASPFMSFSLPSDNILSAEVFVNESRLPKLSMLKMIDEMPEDVRANYDSRGDISEFYVRWNEVENFDASKPGDRHYVIDRLYNVIRFGDGINARIPEASQDAAFTVRIKCCDGAAGNLPEGAIEGLIDRMLYIDDVMNPIPTSGGSNMENVGNAVNRGAGYLNSAGRLVSEADYVRETLNFSDMIADTRCIVGCGSVDIALLMRDYYEGSQAFDRVSDGLRRSILAKCEATLTSEQIRIIEPMYIKIGVEVWVAMTDPHQRFETAVMVEEKIRERIEPLKRADGTGGFIGGWQIGEVPTPSQINIMLHGISTEVIVKKFTATATYIDEYGEHSTELGKLKRKPFMLGVNGAHFVHFIEQ
jgi:hypothetical protein